MSEASRTFSSVTSLESSFKINKENKLTLFQTTINFLKMIFGFGSFVLPASIYSSGWLISSIAFAFAVLLMIWSAFVLGECEAKYRARSKDRSSKLTYTTLTNVILGKAGMYGIQTTLFITVLFMVAFYLTAVSSMLTSNSALHFTHCSAVYIIVAGVLAYLLTFLNNMRLISFACMFGMVSVALSIVLSIVSGLLGSNLTNQIPDLAVKNDFYQQGEFKAARVDFKSLNQLISTTIFLLCLAHCCIEYRQELKSPEKNYKLAVSISILLAAIVNLIYGLSCAYLFRDSLNFNIAFENNSTKYEALSKFNGGDIIINHISEDNKYIKLVASVKLSINLLFSVMLLLKIPVKITEELLSGVFDTIEDSNVAKIMAGVKFALVALCVTVGILLKKKIELFLSVIGAVCFPILSFVFPAIFMIKLGDNKIMEKFTIGIFMVLGIYLSIVGVYLAIC
eukprot:GAHX01001018.1.p1 GENE.GAHX01001018.1~~GAHX01001018.1.p1  ORF type:complete len:453 (+),score=55.67 GAHX01001018.1:339-1697(+)